MDSTHGRKTYDFNLTTILVIDEFGEGIPVGWAISNREDITLLVEFFKASKNRWNLLSNFIAYTPDSRGPLHHCRRRVGDRENDPEDCFRQSKRAGR